jgi:hypothetical protein
MSLVFVVSRSSNRLASCLMDHGRSCLAPDYMLPAVGFRASCGVFLGHGEIGVNVGCCLGS